MKIKISEKQLRLLQEKRLEYDEIVTIPSFDDEITSPRIQPKIVDVDPDVEYGIEHHYDDKSRNEIPKMLLKKKFEKFGYKIIWENKLNIDGLRDIGYVELAQPSDVYVRIFDSGYKLYLKIKLTRYKDGYKIILTEVYPHARGKRLAMRTYLKLVEILKRNLYSDDTQTQESKKGIWEKLYSLYPDRVKAFANNMLYPVKIIDGEMHYRRNKPIYWDMSKDYNQDYDDVQLVLIP